MGLRRPTAGDRAHIDTTLHRTPATRRHTDGEHGPFVTVVRREALPVLTAMAIAIAVMSLIGALVRAVGTIDAWDLDVVREVADRRTGLGADLTELGTYFAETVPVAVLTVLLTLAAWWRWRHWSAPLFVVAAVGGEKLIYLISSIIVGRDRPSVDTLGDTYATRSFPSGHVASAVTLYGAAALLLGVLLGRRWRDVAFVLAGLIALIVAVCRVYRGFHYPTDVAAGAVLGIVWLWFAWSRFGDDIEAAEQERDAGARRDDQVVASPAAR